MAQFDRQDTLNKIINVIAQKMNLDPKALNEATRFQDLGADSLDMVEIVMKFEELFGIEIEDAVADNLTDLRSAVDYINEKRSK